MKLNLNTRVENPSRMAIYRQNPVDRELFIMKRRRSAANAVAQAIKRGELTPAAWNICVDCGAQAQHYGHRDYRNPLDVVPVCKRCNNRRGPGAPYDGPIVEISTRQNAIRRTQ